MPISTAFVDIHIRLTSARVENNNNNTRTRLTCPFLCNAKCAVSSACRRHPVVAQTQIPMVPLFRKSLRFSIDKVFDVCCAGPRCALSVGDSRDPTVAARFFSDQVVDIPVVSTTGAGVEVQKTATVPQLQHIRQGGRFPCWRSSSTRYGRPVIMQRRQVSCWRCLRFCSSPELVDIQLCSREWYSTWRFGGEGAFLTHFASFFALLRLSRS